MTTLIEPGETGDRAAFLATVRNAIGRAPQNHARPIEPLPSPLPIVEYSTLGVLRTDGGQQHAKSQFGEALTALGGAVRTIADGHELAALLDDALAFARRGDSPVRVVLSDDPECDRLREHLAAREDVELLDYDNAETVATADLGITGAHSAVALTGSIVVDAGRAGGRTVSLLPPVHLALVHAETIVATPGEHWRGLAEPMPSNMVQITGPSRSADIELIITLGVHGPRALWVGVLG